MTAAIKNWSISSLHVYEQCAFRAKLARVDKIPEPERPLPPGKTEHANDRGTRVHTGAEMYVQGKGDMLLEMAKFFRLEFEALRRLYKEGKVTLEGEWGMDRGWEPTDWKSKDTWFRLKLDALVHLSRVEAIAIDYKTGKKFGNELKHAEQLQFYAVNTFLRYPDLEVLHTELWYLDVEELTQVTFTRAQALRFKANWDRRGNKMTNDTQFKPNPNVYACNYCPYGPWEGGTGHCKVGVKR